MDITLEQARAFDAVARLGTIQNAALEINKGHSAVVYLLRTLEEQTEVSLFDRAGYRNRITPQGEIVLRYCRDLLVTRDELEIMCRHLKGGWEPSLKIIYDGVIDFNLIADALFRLTEMKAPTEVKVLAAHLTEVQNRFNEEKADMMMTILPIQQNGIQGHPMKSIRLMLVSHCDHPLGKKRKTKLSTEELNQHTFIKIRDTLGHLGLSTESMEFKFSFYVNDFFTKKLAIQKRLGFGWMPEYLIKKELQEGLLVPLRGSFKYEHHLEPRLYHRSEELLGKASKALLRIL